MTSAVHYAMFPQMVQEGIPFTLAADAANLTVTPNMTVVPSTASGTVTMTVKTADKLLGKKTYTLSGGTLSGDALTLTNVSAGKLWLDYSYSGNISEQTVLATAKVGNNDSIQAGV